VSVLTVINTYIASILNISTLHLENLPDFDEIS